MLFVPPVNPPLLIAEKGSKQEQLFSILQMQKLLGAENGSDVTSYIVKLGFNSIQGSNLNQHTGAQWVQSWLFHPTH